MQGKWTHLRQRVLVHLVRIVLLVNLGQPLDVEELEVLRAGSEWGSGREEGLGGKGHGRRTR